MAKRNGAIGVIFGTIYESNTLNTGTVSYNNELSNIPAVCISLRDTIKLRDLLFNGQQVKAHIQVKNELKKDVTARNVIGKIKGLENPDKKVVIGGHLDSWDLGEGAIDNGIGAFAILDIARAFAAQKIIPIRTIEFVFWMVEEQGLMGSKAYIKKHIANGQVDNIIYYLNIDMQGNAKGVDIEGREEMSEYFLKIGDQIKKLGIKYANKIISKPNSAPSSDDVLFAVQGIPTLHSMSNIDGSAYRFYHTNRDSFSLVNEDHMKQSSLAMGIILYHLSNSWQRIAAKKLSISGTKEFYSKIGGSILLTSEYAWDLRKNKVELTD